MKRPPKYEVSEAMRPPPRVVRDPPVAGRARVPTRVGSWDSQLPSSRSVSVCTSLACQSRRSSPSVLFVARSSERPETVTGAPVALARATKRAAESGLTPNRTSVPGSALASEGNAWPRQRPCSAANTNSRLGTMGPPIPPPSWFCVAPWPNGDAVASPHANERSRSAYVNEPCGTLVPPRVVEAMSPPENWPRATSYALVTTRIERTASCGTLPEPNDRPSSVMLFPVGRCPATENAVAVESLSRIPRTPGCKVATVLRSEALMGRRARRSGSKLRALEPGPAPSLRALERALTVMGSSGTANSPIRMLASIRSSSAWRATLTCAGAMPMKRAVSS